nr:unnamed protein product [Spirometra erinaceieuropaei]
MRGDTNVRKSQMAGSGGGGVAIGTVNSFGCGKQGRNKSQSSAGVFHRHNFHKMGLGRAHSTHEQESGWRRNGSRRLSFSSRDVPNFGEGVDQKVLPLPMKPAPSNWMDRTSDNQTLMESRITGKESNLKGGLFSGSRSKEINHTYPLARIFLDAVERGDKSTVIRCLRCPQPVNVNCTNMLGRTAIQIAVDNENFEIVELLLQEPNIRIGDALLYAIQEGVYRIVEMLIDHHSITKEVLGTSWSKRVSRSEESHDFSADISPVILASICNQFEILQLLLSRGARIERPHRSNCSCNDCVMMNREDSLKYSLWRMNTYRALASPAWISLTSPDPVLAAFKLSWELSNLASKENEFKEVFIQLSEQCKKYACDLLDQCRSTEEVLAVLSKSSDSSDEDEAQETEEETESTKRDPEVDVDGNTELRHLGMAMVRRCQRRLHGEEHVFSRPHSSTSHRVASGHDMHRIEVLPDDLLHHPALGRSNESQYTIVEDLDGADVGIQVSPHNEGAYFGQQHGSMLSPPDRSRFACSEEGRINSRKNDSHLYDKEEEYDVDEDGDAKECQRDVNGRLADRAEDEKEAEEEEEEKESQLYSLDRLKLAIKYEQKRVSSIIVFSQTIQSYSCSNLSVIILLTLKYFMLAVF